MIKHFLLLSVGLLFMTVAHSQQKAFRQFTEKHEISGYRFMAWNQDNTNSNFITCYQDNTFTYLLDSAKHTAKDKGRYMGTTRTTGDTLFLEPLQPLPANYVPYLIQETSGGYWIQCFTDGTPRVFLRNIPISSR